MSEDGAGRRAETATKLELVRGVLARRPEVAGAVLSARRNLAWLASGADTHVVRGAEGGVATFVVTASDAFVVTAVNEAPRLTDEELAGLGLDLVAVPWEDPGATARAVRERIGAAGTLADDGALEDELRPLRSRLAPAEQERLAALGRDAARAMTCLFADARPGEREDVVAARLATIMAEDGMAAPVLLAASDERIVRYRHPIPKPKRIERSLMLVIVAERGGLHAAVTRIGWLAGRPDAETLRRYEACLRIDDVLRGASVSGATLAGVLEAGISAYAAEGFPDEWRLHHQGGTIAYQPRETIATPSASETIDPGMAFAWNPSISGAKAEETLLLWGDGRREIVTRDPAWPSLADGSPAILVRN